MANEIRVPIRSARQDSDGSETCSLHSDHRKVAKSYVFGVSDGLVIDVLCRFPWDLAHGIGQCRVGLDGGGGAEGVFAQRRWNGVGERQRDVGKEQS